MSFCISNQTKPSTNMVSFNLLQEIKLLYAPLDMDYDRTSIASVISKMSGVSKIRANDLTTLDDMYGIEAEEEIRKRLEQVRKERANDLKDDTMSIRRAETLSIQY